METLALSSFSLILIVSIVSGIPIAFALLLGFAIFSFYAIRKGNTFKEVMMMALSGISGARNILIAFVLIGMLTASWRCSGTIPAVVCYSLGAVSRSWFLLAAFLTCSLISFLTGTSFGSAATMGVICMTLGNALGVEPALSGGAILSGIFFGDRCSPVSTSALLVSDITKTDIFSNIKGMLRTGAVPFTFTCIIYALLSLLNKGTNTGEGNLTSIFYSSFRISFIPLIPAIGLLILSLCRVRTKLTMALSIAAAIAIAVLYEGFPASNIPSMLIFGYRSPSAELSETIDGGGILSMLNVAIIVAISSSYAGIFSGTGMLDSLKSRLTRLSGRIPSSLITVIVSTISSMISCNQTLATMLTHQLCSDLYSDSRDMALALENSVIVIAPLIPWSIAGSVPLAILDAPKLSLFIAVYLFLLPLWMVISSPHVSGKCA